MIAVGLWVAVLQDPVERAIEKLRSEEIERREEAELELALLGEPAARALVRLAEDPDREVAARARRALEKNRRAARLPASLSARVPRLLQRDLPLAEILALSLTEEEKRFFARRAARDLTLAPPTWYGVVRRRAPAPDVALAVRRGGSPELRAYALAALQELDPAGSVRLAAELLRSAEPPLRLQAALTLGEAGPPSAAGDLRRLLRDPSPAVAEGARIALLRTTRARPAPLLWTDVFDALRESSKNRLERKTP